ncbi:flagellar hook-length control protein FliK [Jonesia quinghaiensis]|uniref:flagellar hook-length control protein FliK n=1 Tax=Jonesia quinghaiensis TaxID=262806 RepID=UPI0003FAB2BC|nr:flagellar hook-length control protein FliK [Jonesia quinghaiensis]
MSMTVAAPAVPAPARTQRSSGPQQAGSDGGFDQHLQRAAREHSHAESTQKSRSKDAHASENASTPATTDAPTASHEASGTAGTQREVPADNATETTPEVPTGTEQPASETTTPATLPTTGDDLTAAVTPPRDTAQPQAPETAPTTPDETGALSADDSVGSETPAPTAGTTDAEPAPIDGAQQAHQTPAAHTALAGAANTTNGVGQPATPAGTSASTSGVPGAQPVTTAPVAGAAPIPGAVAGGVAGQIVGQGGQPLVSDNPTAAVTATAQIATADTPVRDGQPQLTALPVTTTTATTSAAPVSAAQAAQSTSPDVGQNLVNQLKGPLVHLKQAANGDHSFSVRVTPENLGPISIRAHVTSDGVRIEITCVNDTARDAIRPLVTDLKKELQGSGLQADLNLGHGSQSGHSDTPSRSDTGSGPAPAANQPQTEPALTDQPAADSSRGVDVIA